MLKILIMENLYEALVDGITWILLLRYNLTYVYYFRVLATSNDHSVSFQDCCEVHFFPLG